jgi:hypothetical protein
MSLGIIANQEPRSDTPAALSGRSLIDRYWRRNGCVDPLPRPPRTISSEELSVLPTIATAMGSRPSTNHSYLTPIKDTFRGLRKIKSSISSRLKPGQERGAAEDTGSVSISSSSALSVPNATWLSVSATTEVPRAALAALPRPRSAPHSNVSAIHIGDLNRTQMLTHEPHSPLSITVEAPAGPLDQEQNSGPRADIAPPIHANPAFLDALKEYEEKLSDEERKEFDPTTAASPQSLLSAALQLDTDHRERSSSRSLACRVKKILESMDRFMGVLCIAIQHSPEVSSLVVGGIRCILDVRSLLTHPPPLPA